MPHVNNLLSNLIFNLLFRPPDKHEFDDTSDDAAEATVINIEGMKCMSCVNKITSSVNELPGVYTIKVNILLLHKNIQRYFIINFFKLADRSSEENWLFEL